VPTAAGFFYGVDQLTIPEGRTFVSGPLRSSSDQVISLPCSTLDLGAQSNAWVMFRDKSRVAVSLGLPAAPNIVLWDQITINLWCAAQPGRNLLQCLPLGRLATGM
jgi:hypothetical protein